MNIFVEYNGKIDEIEVLEDSTAENVLLAHFKGNKDILTCSIGRNKTETILCDLSTELKEGDFVKFFDFENSEEGKHVFWHSSAHVLGNALVNLFNCNLVNGPPIEEGFYYDIDTEVPIKEEDFSKIEREMIRLIKKGTVFRREYLEKDELRTIYKNNECKLHFVEKTEENLISIYRNVSARKNDINLENFTLKEKGNEIFMDMCRGPHIKNTNLIKTVKIVKTSACYFLNDPAKKSLQRVYGISFPRKELMKKYEERIKRSKEMDHRKIGRELDLFFFHEYSPGSCFWLPDGAFIYNKLQEFIREEYKKRGFNEVISPNIFHTDLWKESGHYENYKDNIYMIENEDFALKPMNCPGHCLMYKSTERSYKDLPLRLADFGVLHRNECSGSLTGLTRVRRFQQDDAHIFLMRNQVKEEIKSCLQFLRSIYSVFGFSYDLFLSTRPQEKFMGSLQEWEEAEESLKLAILESGHKFMLNPGDGAFYGPKIDIVLLDALGRKNQCATIQLDFQLPQRFKLKYKSEEGLFEAPVMIHRAILGSVERFIAILIESYGKKLPFWLTPRQIALISVTEENNEYLLKLTAKLKRFETHSYLDSKDTLNKKVRKAETEGYRILCVAGKKEQENDQINVRFNGESKVYQLEEFVRICNEACETKKEPIF
ncbi:threonine--tRNA [Nucleospora cyclopteri]